MSIMFVTACDKNSTEPEKNDPNKHPAELVGSWNTTAQNMDVIVTSRSAQKMADTFSKGIGSIKITGDQQAELNYLIRGREDDGTLVVVATNLKDLFGFDENDYPVCYLMFRMITNPTAILNIMLSETEGVVYAGLGTSFSYDSENHTLTATQLQLIEVDLGDSVTVNGTLSNVLVDIPANTPTRVLTMEMNPEAGSLVIFSADGKFSRTSMYDWGTENSIGTWEVSDSENLKIIETYNDEYDQTIINTIDGNFIVNANVLTINYEMSVCEVFDNPGSTDCVRQFEEDFFLDIGSLSAMTVQAFYTLSKSTVEL